DPEQREPRPRNREQHGGQRRAGEASGERLPQPAQALARLELRLHERAQRLGGQAPGARWPAPLIRGWMRGQEVVRIYTGSDGESHFEDVLVSLADDGHLGRMSKLVPARGVIFREVGGDYALGFHNAPRRQYVVNLTGSVELETGDGTKRVLGPG